MQTWWNRYLHAGFDPAEETILAWRGRVLAITCLAIASACTLLVAVQAYARAWSMVAVFCAVVVASLVLPLVPRSEAGLERAGHVAVAVGFTGVTASIVFRGGLSSPLPIGLALVPAVAAYLFPGRRSVLGWAAIALGTVIAVGVVPQALGITLVDRMPLVGRSTVGYLAPLLVLVFITLLSRASARVQVKTIEAAMLAERRRLEDEQANHLQRAEQMALVGQLAVGVAHEVNNPLAYIGANIDYTAKRLRQDDEKRWSEELAALRDAADGVVRISDIVNQLNAHGRKEEQDVKPMRLRDSLELALRIARNQIRHRARVYRQYDDDPVVEADPGRLTQVFLNLLVNAAQAVPTGKRNDHEIRIGLRIEGSMALVEVRDTGSGIAPEVLARVTEPFFTTKDVGQGTGLGLSISDAIVRSYAGTMRLWSEVGRGTRVEIRLPLSDDAPITIQEHDQEHIPLPAPAREPRLLLIDDDATVRRGLARVLPGEVMQAGHAREALELIEDNPRFDVIVCDVMMPDMTGIDFYRELSKRYPELCARTMFVTGGVFDESALEYIAEQKIPMLTKPVRREQLATMVDQLMSK
ncbi:MAG: response regulator [Myxococcales bacterium]|nr:response regulator [Myxococcales bacterium]